MNPRGRPTILLIDDEPVVRSSIRINLEDSGYVVLEAENGLVGLELFEKEDIDCVLVDLRMPKMDGLEFLSRLGVKAPDLPIIVISDTSEVENVVKALRLGAWDYLLKPLDDRNLLNHSIDTCLERSKLLQENKKYKNNLEICVGQKTQELSRLNTRIQDIVETSKKLIGCGDIDKSGSLILHEFAKHMQAVGGSLYKVTEKGLRLLSCLDTGHAVEWIPFPLKKGSVIHRIMESGEPLLLDDVDADESIIPSGWKKYTDSSFLAFPISNGKGGIYAIISLHSKNTPPFNSQDREIGIILSSYLRELLQKVEVTAALENSESHLRQAQKMEAIGTLAGGIAHDFNNILTAIIGYTDLSLYAESCSGSLKRNLQQIRNASNRAKDLVSQILAFSRTEEFKDDAVDIGPIIQEALKLLRATIPASIEIEQDIPVGFGKVVTDPTKIYQVLMNLCTNAAHAMQDQEGTLTVILEQVPDSEKHALSNIKCRFPSLRLTVEDTGVGMPQEMVNRIFDPYFTTKEKGEGTGLGLAVVHGIVRSSGGDIRVESEQGQGSKFYLYFPIIHEEVSYREDIITPRIPGGKETILFVDDESALTEMAGHMLEMLGYRVQISTSSTNALELFKKSPDGFDLLITDQTMPGLSGINLAKEVLAIKPDLPVILYSGYPAGLDFEEVTRFGIRQFLTKPLSMSVLAEVVRKTLDEYT